MRVKFKTKLNLFTQKKKMTNKINEYKKKIYVYTKKKKKCN